MYLSYTHVGFLSYKEYPNGQSSSPVSQKLKKEQLDRFMDRSIFYPDLKYGEYT